MASLFGKVRAPFYDNGRWQPLLITIFVLINLIVLINAVIHDPSVGYDAEGHFKYIVALSQGHLPTIEETHEFFSPPLPYLLPSAAKGMASISVNQAAKLAQLLNLFLSIGTTFFLIKICHLVSPNNSSLKIVALAFLGMLPVYYKTFAFIRGEPYVVFFVMVGSYYALQIFGNLQTTTKNRLLLGIALGLAGLSRQWGFLLIPAITLLTAVTVLKQKSRRRPLIASFIISLSLAFLISSWFFLTLSWRYGSTTTFNRIPYEKFALSNQVEGFFSNFKTDFLFTEPVRDNFNNQLWPIFYAEMWGDYWGYFNVYGKDVRTGEWLGGYAISSTLMHDPQTEWLETNRYTLAPYLGRVNRLGLLPSLLGIIALFYGGVTGIWHLWQKKEPGIEAAALTLFFFLTMTSVAAYFWFLVMYPTDYGDTIKATYMLHIFPGIAFMVGVFLLKLEQKRPGVLLVCGILGGIIFLHNLATYFTRFILY